MMVIRIIFLLLVFTLAKAREPCPFANEVKPCECFVETLGTTLHCSDIRDKDELQRVFDNFPDFPMYLFTLQHSSMPHLNASWFVAKQFQEVQFLNLTLLDLFESSTNLSIPKVTSMHLTQLKLLRGVLWPHVRAFEQLTQLRVLETEVKRLGKEFRDNVPNSLVTLMMSTTKTAELEDDAFKGKTKLKRLAINDNQLRVIKKSFFEDQMDTLSWIDFSYNPLETIPDDLFEGMEKLGRVNFASTGMKTLPKQWDFSGNLEVDGNPFMCDCKMSWIPKSSFSDLYGTCESPTFLKSKELDQLTEEDFKDCENALPFEH